MAWFLFIDESGHDGVDSPYGVLAGVAVRDANLWGLINELHALEFRHFGRRYSEGTRELKGTKILKNKVFHHAQLNVPIDPREIPVLAKQALDDGPNANIRHLKALALAKRAYVEDLLIACRRNGCRVFASIVEQDARPTASGGLRKDYAYLFERFYYFLEDLLPPEQGIIVFDELEKTKSHILIDQTHRYFKDTATGKLRAGLIVPEPLFVHSDLTTGVQIADIFAYCISWAFRTPRMNRPKREELSGYVEKIADMRYRAIRSRQGKNNFEIWSIAHITDLRTNIEKDPFDPKK